jgi:hypothetical protein
MNAYEEKRERRLERYQELAHKFNKESISSHERSNKLAEMIPFGQPILVGHHSEGAHRNHIKKIHSAMNKCIELADKSTYYENKVDSLLNNNAISSDDPEAVTKLKEKLEKLLKEREVIKARKHQAYELSNLSGNIATVKKRIEYLTKLQNTPEIADIEVNSVVLRVNKELNRVQLIYPSKPSEEERTKLKHNGFRWSPYESAWQRQFSRYALDEAKRIIGVQDGN